MREAQSILITNSYTQRWAIMFQSSTGNILGLPVSQVQYQDKDDILLGNDFSCEEVNYLIFDIAESLNAGAEGLDEVFDNIIAFREMFRGGEMFSGDKQYRKLLTKVTISWEAMTMLPKVF